MTIGDRIKERRKELNLSQRELAERMGYSNHSTVVRVEAGQVDLPQSRIVKFAYIMGWETDNNTNNADHEMYGILPITIKSIPFLGEISCGEPIFASEDRQSYVASGVNVKADFCLKAKGDSMINARIYDGDIVFIQKCDMVENGTIAAVVIGDDALLKRVFYYPEQGKLLLVAENTKYPPLVYEGEELNTVKILGKAIAFQSDVI